MPEAPIFEVQRQGRLGNQMIQYMIARKFAALTGCRIANVSLPEWGIEHPAIRSDAPAYQANSEHHLDFTDLPARVKSGEISRIVYSGFGHRLENFDAADACRTLFQSPLHRAVGCGADELVCHIRAGDIQNPENPHHVMTPIAFYADLVAATGLRPVFMGETQASPYTDQLRARFPSAIFLPQRDILLDFETIRQSRNIAVGVSSFCWLAAWLSHADRIFMSVNGMFNPRQYPAIDLLPYDDARYQFYLFPLNYGLPVERLEEAHGPMRPLWRPVQAELLRHYVQAAPVVPHRIGPYLTLFDAAFYLRDPAIGAGLATGRFADANDHFVRVGFAEGRAAFAIDPAWYARRYPMAAFQVAQGDYLDLAHFHAEIGHASGYHPLPG